jgi:multiple sugar transport system substrate-binding protein
MKKILIMLAITTLLAPVLFSGGASQGGQQAAAGKPAVVTHWYWVPNADQPMYKAVIDEFNKTHTDVQVNFENVPQKDVRMKFITAYQVGEGPDTFGINSQWIIEFANMGMLEDLDKYVDKWPGKDDIFPNFWHFSRFNGKLYVIPWKLNVLYMYYRADWLKELGLSVPKNVEEFTAVAKALTGKYKNEDGQEIDRYGFGLRGGDGGYSPYFTWIQNYGAKITDDNGKTVGPDGKVYFDSAIAREGTKRYFDYFHVDKVVPPSCVSDGMTEMIANFKSGRTGMIFHHIGTYVELSKAMGDKISASHIPAGPGDHRWTQGSIINHGISSISKNKEAAFTFISWMSESWAVDFLARNLGSVPVLQSVGNQQYYQDNIYFKVSNEAAQYVGGIPMTINWSNMAENSAERLLQQGLMREISVDEYVKRYSAELAKP